MSSKSAKETYALRPAEVIIERWATPIYDLMDDPASFHRGMAELPKYVHHVIGAELLLWQVNNGGFHQYFFNDYGLAVDYAIDGLRRIELRNYADICVRAKSLLGTEFPQERLLRIALIGDDYQHRKIDFDAIDNEFYELDPDHTGFAYDVLDAYAMSMLKSN